MIKEVIKPMLCSSTKPQGLRDYESNEWVAEVKIDGSRTLLFLDFENNYVRVQSRSGNNLTKQFPEFKFGSRAGLTSNVSNVILDGELITNDMLFSTIQGRCHKQDNRKIYLAKKFNPATLIVFDILWLNNNDLTNLPFKERRGILEKVIKKSSHIQLIPQFKNNFGVHFQNAVENNFEGLVMKNLSSKYDFNRRGWVKCRKYETQEVEIDGFDNGDSGFALVLNTCKGRVSIPNPEDINFFNTNKPRFVEVACQEMTKEGNWSFVKFRDDDL